MVYKLLNKKVLVIVVIALLLGAGAVGYKLTRNDSAAGTSGGSKVNLKPATESEKKETEAHKDELAKNSGNTSNPSSTDSRKAVTPVITRAAQDVVNAYVSGIFEEGGRCTATFTQDSRSFSKTSKGVQNASYTQCEPIFLSKTDFPSTGTWSVVVKYESATALGASQAAQLTVN